MSESLSIEEILLNARQNDIEHMLCVAIDLDGSPEIVELARQYDVLSASVGVHPNTELKEDISVDDILSLANANE
ncbi:MAG: TatD family hydrolase, partial [Proteobacteria bacterium]|nr:TatD family hydrolase [Pseudomonadota bacterium]